MADNGKGKTGETCETSGIIATDEYDRLTEMMANSRKDKNEKKHRFIKSFRESFRRVGEMNPLTQKNAVVSGKTETTNTESGIANTPDSPVQPPAPSREELKKRDSGKWSKLGSKREKTPTNKQLELVKEDLGSSEFVRPELTVEAAEVQKLYTLPEIPKVPLSVMQIDKLIKDGVLGEGYVNLRCLEQEVQCELKALGEGASPVDLAHREKDVKLLYKTLRDKLTEIVQHSCAQPSPNKEQLLNVVCIIQEEEKRGDDGGMGGGRDVWKSAVKDGVNETLKCVHLDSPEQNASWLAVHLGQVGKVIVENLIKVKTELVSAYPPSFNVLDTYVSSFHEGVGEHLKGLYSKVTELKDFYALLDFIINHFSSEKIMSNKSLQPELKKEQQTLHLDGDFLEQIKNAYCKCLQADLQSSLNKIIELEQEEMWKDQKIPVIDEALYDSHIHMDIWMAIKGPIQASGWLDVNTEQKVVSCCLDELKHFPKRFEEAFVKWSSSLENHSLHAPYYITYINSFTALKQHMESYKERCPDQVLELDRELDGLVDRLRQALLEHFKTDTKNYLRRMMTRKWLSNDEDFQQLLKRIETLSQHCTHMSRQNAQVFVSDLHFYVVREYISQLMMHNYSCKNRKNERAATKIDSQWGHLCEHFQEMNSTKQWLYPVGNYLSKIIGVRKKSEIQNHLQPLVKDYPDFSKKHLSAVLHFRGVVSSRERRMILQQLSEIKRNTKSTGIREHALFSEIEASANTACLAMPFPCLSVLMLDRD